jgi:hypothetical protein
MDARLDSSPTRSQPKVLQYIISAGKAVSDSTLPAARSAGDCQPGQFG